MIRQLTNQNLDHPKRILEDVLKKVGKLIIPIDFIVLYFQADERPLVILERPFLVTRGALIDLREGVLIMRMDDKEAFFKVCKPIYTSSNYKDLCMITVIEWEKYGVVGSIPQKTSLDFLID